MRSETWYQTILIVLGLIACILFGVFFIGEIFPEYRIYQNRYVRLEEIRSKITGVPVPFFKGGVKQIVIQPEDKGPETIDRCISCHVALELDHFSPTKIAYDLNGKMIFDHEGYPILEKNENYIWDLLPQGEESLKSVKVGNEVYDVTKVLQMHPLIGKETRPFEFHPIEVYGCTSCHSGNGRSLVTDRAHGPIYDETYEAEIIANKPEFLERDPKNDPKFAKVFNEKPGPRLLFQTKPLFVGDLIQANCVQCHQPTSAKLSEAVEDLNRIASKKETGIKSLQEAILNEQASVISLFDLKTKIQKKSPRIVLDDLEKQKEEGRYSQLTLENISAQMRYLNDRLKDDRNILEQIENDLVKLLGSNRAVQELQGRLAQAKDPQAIISQYIEEMRKKGYSLGTLFAKAATIAQDREAMYRIKNAGTTLKSNVGYEEVIKGLSTEVDKLTRSYQRGQELYISQACYACHRIAGFSRGGVGPELTDIGASYPWFIKESIVWPQADLATSVMPNMYLDHKEIEDLMTFLLAQKTDSPKKSEVGQRVLIKAWEEGKKQLFEQPISPTKIFDIRFAKKVYALEGCAACHRLKGFESDVGYQIENESPDPLRIYEESRWFQSLFPEGILGSSIVKKLEMHRDEINQRIVGSIRKGSILEEIEKDLPGSLASFYSNFQYASRSKHDELWQDLVWRVLMMYIQEYGLGRQIGPKINWSGVYRSDQWLMEHFWNPQGHSARSIMPVFPFDNSKFLSLTHMLDDLGEKNRDQVHTMWELRRFNPEETYRLLCSQCHGPYLRGDGPVSEWIYPIPKNLRDPVFLRNLTKENVTKSITHGIKGTPMPPWGEVGEGKRREGFTPVLTEKEINQLVDWIFEDLPAEYIDGKSEILKWQYGPEDVIEELKEEVKQPPEDKDKLSFSSLFFSKVFAEDPRTSIQVDDVFQCIEEEDSQFYEPGCYIRKIWYTPDNIREGERLFLLNCSICHGREGDGSGLRAGTMIEAKPRMLTNLDWLETRDDLRLLRSIKFGVPGTAMPAWGDITTALQRLQMVVYIRSLTQKQKLSEQLSNAIYQSFDQSKWAVDQVRAKEYETIEEQKQELELIKYQRQTAMLRLQTGELLPEEAKETYVRELELISKIQKQEKRDHFFEELLSLIDQRKQLFQRIGNNILNLEGEEMIKLLDLWIQVIRSFGNDFTYSKEGLEFQNGNIERKNQIRDQVISSLEEDISDLKERLTFIQGKIPSLTIREEKQQIEQHLNSILRLQTDMLTTFAEAQRLKEKEADLFLKIKDSDEQPVSSRRVR